MIHGVDTSFLNAVELASHPRHAAACQLLLSLHQGGDQFALAPQVLAEFVHIVTDPKRCAAPLTMNDALDRAEQLWNAAETVQVFPNYDSITQFFTSMRQHLDAATPSWTQASVGYAARRDVARSGNQLDLIAEPIRF